MIDDIIIALVLLGTFWAGWALGKTRSESRLLDDVSQGVRMGHLTSGAALFLLQRMEKRQAFGDEWLQRRPKHDDDTIWKIEEIE